MKYSYSMVKTVVEFEKNVEKIFRALQEAPQLLKEANGPPHRPK